MKNKSNKRAQEEMVGFVLIMVVVAVIFVVFLGIFLRKNAVQTADSEEISQFLEAVVPYSTECGPDGHPESISRTVVLCGEGVRCPAAPDEEPCEILADTLEGIINSSWNFNPDSPTKGYQLSVLRESDQDSSVLGRTIRSGDITSTKRRSAEKVFDGGIILRLEVYL